MTDKSRHLSLAYKKEIAEACKPLSGMGIKYMLMYLVFNNGNTFVLTNANPDASHVYQNNDHYVCGEHKALFEHRKKHLTDTLGVHTTYDLVRHHPECTFVFGAVSESPVESAESFYKKTFVNFERFCASFIERFLDLIIACHPDYKNSFILTSKKLRGSVISRAYLKETNIPDRALDCLRLAAQGKSAKQIAQHLCISNFTVEQYLKSIREKFHCDSVIEAVVEGIHRGLIGRMIPVHEHRLSA